MIRPQFRPNDRQQHRRQHAMTRRGALPPPGAPDTRTAPTGHEELPRANGFWVLQLDARTSFLIARAACRARTPWWVRRPGVGARTCVTATIGQHLQRAVEVEYFIARWPCVRQEAVAISHLRYYYGASEIGRGDRRQQRRNRSGPRTTVLERVANQLRTA